MVNSATFVRLHLALQQGLRTVDPHFGTGDVTRADLYRYTDKSHLEVRSRPVDKAFPQQERPGISLHPRNDLSPRLKRALFKLAVQINMNFHAFSPFRALPTLPVC